MIRRLKNILHKNKAKEVVDKNNHPPFGPKTLEKCFNVDVSGPNFKKSGVKK